MTGEDPLGEAYGELNKLSDEISFLLRKFERIKELATFVLYYNVRDYREFKNEIEPMLREIIKLSESK